MRIIVFTLVLGLLVKTGLKCTEYEIKWVRNVHTHHNKVRGRVEYTSAVT